jgi:hypothetical protein
MSKTKFPVGPQNTKLSPTKVNFLLTAGVPLAVCYLMDKRYQLLPRKLYYKLLQNRFPCHPERSEGSQALGTARFFALLSMAIEGILRF